jgi:hypothetical protein
VIVEARTPLKILDFDIENRPLAYMGEDYTSAEITAIAACWDGKPKTMQAWLLGQDEPELMLAQFLAMYDEADMVTGHYIRMHDLPVINGAMMEYGFPSLSPKLTSDTKIDLVSRKYISASQENLGEMLGIPAPKVHMSNAKWREANRLTSIGLRLTRERAVGDVIQHMAIRRELVKRGLLSIPKMWRP